MRHVKAEAELLETPVEYRASNPKLDFFGHDGRYLYSSNWYRTVAHARAHLPGRGKVTGIVGSIRRSIKR